MKYVALLLLLMLVSSVIGYGLAKVGVPMPIIFIISLVLGYNLDKFFKGRMNQ